MNTNMSVREYLILLVLICGLGGLALAGYIFKEQYELDSDKRLLEHANALHADAERFADQARYLFVTSDLLFGAQETYMAGPAEEQAAAAKALLTELSNNTPNEWQTESKLLGQLQHDVDVLSDEIQALSKGAQSLDFSVSAEQLNSVDLASLSIIRNTEELSRGFKRRIDQLEVIRTSKHSMYGYWVAGLAGIYIIAVLLVLRWTVLAVNKPLVALADHARLAMDDYQAMSHTSSGPKEVRELSDHMNSLVGYLDGKLSEFQAIVEAMPDAMLLLHRTEGIQYWKPGSSLSEAVGDLNTNGIDPSKWASGKQRVEMQKLMEICLDTNKPQISELELTFGEQLRYYEMRMIPAAEDTVVLIVRDLTEKRRSEEHIKHMAYHDSLTGLMNRHAFTSNLTELILKQPKQPFTVLFIDLDRFKRINDYQGHEVGDRILMHVANCVQHSLRASDHIALAQDGPLSARVGGDEFLAVLPGVANPEQITQIAERLLKAIAKPTTVRGSRISCSVSLGAAIYPQHGQEVEDVIKHADLAMFEAKRKGGNRLNIYDDELGARTYRKFSIESRLKGALERDELHNVYQPKLNLHSGDVVGAEALLRWQSGDKYIPPDEFIPVAEESGLIIDIGDWVLERVCKDITAWAKEGFEVPCVAVNVSLLQLQKADYVDNFIDIVKSYDLDFKRISVEVTESVMLNESAPVISKIDTLRSMGVEVALDDFGTGYSSLNYLRNLPVDILKIDRGFILDLATDTKQQGIVSAIVELAKQLGLLVVAEGVEDEEQIRLLRNFECDEAQGYFYSPPLKQGEFRAFCLARGSQLDQSAESA